jgi:hypothetical protein
MKTLKKTLLLFCAGVMGTFLFSCHDEDRPKDPAALIVPGSCYEDSIDLILHPMTQALGELHIANCQKNIFIDQTIPLLITGDSIRKNALKAMTDSALHLQGNCNTSYLLALRIIYGLNEANTKIKLYYQPVFLKRITVGGKDSIEYKPKKSPYFYHYDGTSFVYVPDSAIIDSAKARYARHIYFKIPGGGFRKFYPGTTDTSDVTACLFSAQEIKEMITENQSKYIYIINSGDNIMVGTKRYLRHVMLLGPDSLSHGITDIFYRKYGNLTHLCPPNCNSHYFNLKF